MRAHYGCDAVSHKIDVVLADTIAYPNLKVHVSKNWMNSLIEIGQALKLFENLMRSRGWIELLPSLLPIA